jgi:hypothetical protein
MASNFIEMIKNGIDEKYFTITTDGWTQPTKSPSLQRLIYLIFYIDKFHLLALQFIGLMMNSPGMTQFWQLYQWMEFDTQLKIWPIKSQNVLRKMLFQLNDSFVAFVIMHITFNRP